MKRFGRRVHHFFTVHKFTRIWKFGVPRVGAFRPRVLNKRSEYFYDRRVLGVVKRNYASESVFCVPAIDGGRKTIVGEIRVLFSSFFRCFVLISL